MAGRRQELVDALREVAALLRDDVTLLESLELVAEDARGGARRVVAALAEDVRGGLPLSEAMLRHPGVFPDSLIAAVWGGERSGQLVEVLLQHTSYLQRRAGRAAELAVRTLRLRLLVLCNLAVLGLLLGFALPVLYGLTAAEDPSLRGGVALGIRVAQGALLVSLLVLWTGLRARRTGRIRMLPLGPSRGERYRHAAMFADSLAVLLRADVPLPDAAAIAARGIAGAGKRGASSPGGGWPARLAERLAGGEPLSRALAGWERLPRSFAPLLAGGERTGDLVGVLEEASRIYEAHAQGLLDREGRTFQLAFTLICGLLVGSTALLLFGAYYGLAASLAGAAG